jgi:hypothetical protein
MSVLASAGSSAASVGGRAIGAVFGAVSSLRPAAKPLHPVGSVSTGVLRRRGSAQRSGVPWLDEPGEEQVLLRLSRSVGLPPPVPDVFGLALRVPTDAPGGPGHGDLLFSGTGRGPLSRFLLVPSLSARSRTLGTLLPYRTPVGPVVLVAEPRGATAFDLSWACGRGPWVRFATVEVDPDAEAAGDAPLSFDPVRNTVPGLEVYGWVRRLREPSYRTARRSRGLPD